MTALRILIRIATVLLAAVATLLFGAALGGVGFIMGFLVGSGIV